MQWGLCLFLRSVTVEYHKPSIPRSHAQRLAGHLPTLKPPRSSDKSGGRQAAAVSCEVETVTETMSTVEKVTSAEVEELGALPQTSAAGLMRVDERGLQQKKDALRFVTSCVTFRLQLQGLCHQFVDISN